MSSPVGNILSSALDVFEDNEKYGFLELDVACLYCHKDLAPFSANAASREQAATVDMIKYKHDWAHLVKSITRHTCWDNGL